MKFKLSFDKRHNLYYLKIPMTFYNTTSHLNEKFLKFEKMFHHYIVIDEENGWMTGILTFYDDLHI